MRAVLLFLLTGLLIAFPVERLFYSLQIASFMEESLARSFLQKLPDDIKVKAFIYRTDKGKYTVRVGLARRAEDLIPTKELLRRRGFRDVFVVPTLYEKVKVSEKGLASELIPMSTSELREPVVYRTKRQRREVDIHVKELKELKVSKASRKRERKPRVLRRAPKKKEKSHIMEKHTPAYRRNMEALSRTKPFVVAFDQEFRELKLLIEKLTSGREPFIKKTRGLTIFT